MTTSKDNQGRAHDVPTPPADDMWIAAQFYAWVLLVVGIIGGGIVLAGWAFAAGALSGALLVFLLACFALGMLAP